MTERKPRRKAAHRTTPTPAAVEVSFAASNIEQMLGAEEGQSLSHSATPAAIVFAGGNPAMQAASEGFFAAVAARHPTKGDAVTYVDDNGTEHDASVDEVMTGPRTTVNLTAPSIPQHGRASGIPHGSGPGTFHYPT